MRIFNLYLIIAFFAGGSLLPNNSFHKIESPDYNRDLDKNSFFKSKTEQKEDNSWELFKDEEGIQIYSRVLPGSTWHQRKGTTIVNTSPSGVVSLIKDDDAGPKWIDRMLHYNTLRTVSEKEWYTYSELKIPWPFSNRDLITRNVVSLDPVTKTVTITLVSDPDFIPEKEDKVRMGKSEGAWIIEPLENNKSKLTYLMWSEPGRFVIPQSIITPIVVNSIHTTMKSMKEILKKDKYRNADMTYLK